MAASFRLAARALLLQPSAASYSYSYLSRLHVSTSPTAHRVEKRLVKSEQDELLPQYRNLKDESMKYESVYVHPDVMKGKKAAFLPADFKEGPERDVANFAHYQRPWFTPKVRMGFIPDSWFNFFYEKTGVSGPYLFLGGLTAFLFSKEIIVIEHSFKHLPAFICLAIVYTKFLGGWTAKHWSDYQDMKLKLLDDWRASETSGSMHTVQMEKYLQECYPNIMTYLYAAKKENVALQLEAAYRQRLEQVNSELKRRLDCMFEAEATKRRFQQAVQVEWIISQVRKSITPELEDKALKQCVVDLKMLTPS